MVSCVSDLTHWIQLQLDSGRYNGQQILPWPVLQKTREGNTLINIRGSGANHFTAYGLGVFIKDYNGKIMYEHTGGADGFVTNVCFLPEEKLGITILTNNDNQSFFELLRYQIIRAYLNMPYVNLSKASLAGFGAERRQSLDSIAALQARVKGNAPPLPLNAYAGTYTNPLFGDIVMVPEKDALKILFPKRPHLTATLQYMDHQQWLLQYSHPGFGIFPLTFTTVKGRVTGTDLRVNEFLEYDPYTFKKK